MPSPLRQFFRNILPSPEETPAAAELPMAAAVLLLEVARADFESGEAEYLRLQAVLQRHHQVDGKALDSLLGQAESEADRTVSLHRHLEVINRHCEPDDKVQLLQGLWEVAYADGELHHYEEHLIRRLAELLYLPHSQFIRTKLLAAGAAGSG